MKKASKARPPAKTVGKKPDFRSFVLGRGCFLCGIKERDELQKFKREGVVTEDGRRIEVSISDVCEFLVQLCGYAEEKVFAARPTMGNHFANHWARGSKKVN